MAKSKAVLSELADEVLAAATADAPLSKVAAEVTAPKSDVGEQLSKLAAAMRAAAPTVTYADIREFRNRYGI